MDALSRATRVWDSLIWSRDDPTGGQPAGDCSRNKNTFVSAALSQSDGPPCLFSEFHRNYTIIFTIICQLSHKHRDRLKHIYLYIIYYVMFKYCHNSSHSSTCVHILLIIIIISSQPVLKQSPQTECFWTDLQHLNLCQKYKQNRERSKNIYHKLSLLFQPTLLHPIFPSF